LYWLCLQAAAAASPPDVSLALVAEALAAEQQRLAVKVGALRRRRLEVRQGSDQQVYGCWYAVGMCIRLLWHGCSPGRCREGSVCVDRVQLR
jgi:hypothetical protein